MRDPKHPIWPIIRLAVFMVALVVILWLNASHFDITELRTILAMFFVAAGGESITSFFNREKK